MLTPVELGDFITKNLSRSAFRLEVYDCYDVASDGVDYGRFLAGEAAPTPERKQPWLDHLRKEKAAGIHRYRVHVLRTPLTDYLRYECEWGYTYNSEAGEDIRILDLSEQPEPAGLVDHDFWLIDDAYAIRMVYDGDGQFLGAELVPELLATYRRARDAAVTTSQPFPSWWQRHPQEWREHRVA